MLNTLGVTIIGETINRLFTPTMSVNQLNVAENGKWVSELYSTDTYNNLWYHNYSVEKVAEVVAERLRWIIGLRSTAPSRSEFDW